MDTKQIHAAALAKGAHVQALTEIAALASVHFGDADPSPADVEQFLASLPVWTLRGIEYETFAALPPVEQMRLEREFKPQPPTPVHSRRPGHRLLTAEELKSLEGLDRHKYNTRARQMQQSPPEPHPDAP